jgi:hypothetical protein
VRSGALKPTANVNEIARASFNKDFSKLSRKEYASLLLEAQAIPEMKETLDNARRGAISLQTVDEAIAVEEHSQNLAAVEQARVSANQKLGLELSPEAFNLVALAKVKRASDPVESEKLLDEALRVQSVEAKRQGLSNQTTGEITRALGTFMKEDSFNREVGIVQASAASIAKTQVRRSMEMMAGSLEVDLKTTLLSQPDQERARAAITRLQTGRPQDLLNLPDTDVKLLLETNTGRALMQQRDVVKRITDLQDNQAIKAAGSPEEQKAVFKDSMQGLKAVSEEQISKLADTFVSQGGAAAAEQAMASFATNVVGDVVTSAPSGRLRETEKGTGEEQLMLQTNINLQILQAMQALAAQLRAGR